MDLDELDELHYLTSVDNLASICERGIVSHDLADKLPHADLSNLAMQDLRQGKDVAYAGQERPRKLHSYANLFVHGRNSMLKDLCFRHGHENVAVLAVSTDVLHLPGVVIADQNAASKYVRFYASPNGLTNLSAHYVFARSWGDPMVDQIDYWRRKSRRSAEVLAPDCVESKYLLSAYVSCTESCERCEGLDLPLSYLIDDDLFFL